MGNVSRESPFVVRFLAWMAERFPLANGVFAFVLSVAALAYGKSLATAGRVSFGARDILGFLGVYSFFLMLRVFDEHKDYESDRIYHPQRVLQRGLITLGHLKVVGLLAIVMQAAASLTYDRGFGRVTLLWVGTFAWSLLMAREFFVPEWLRPRLLLYTFSHMLVMPLAMLWMLQMGMGSHPMTPQVLWMALLAFFAGLTFEIGRKFKAPEEEREGVDSYTRRFGTRRAPFVLLLVIVVAALLVLEALQSVLGGHIGVLAMAFLALMVAFPGGVLFAFWARPTPQRAKLAGAASGLAILLAYCLIIGVLAAERGVAWL